MYKRPKKKKKPPSCCTWRTEQAFVKWKLSSDLTPFVRRRGLLTQHVQGVSLFWFRSRCRAAGWSERVSRERRERKGRGGGGGSSGARQGDKGRVGVTLSPPPLLLEVTVVCVYVCCATAPHWSGPFVSSVCSSQPPPLPPPPSPCSSPTLPPPSSAPSSHKLSSTFRLNSRHQCASVQPRRRFQAAADLTSISQLSMFDSLQLWIVIQLECVLQLKNIIIFIFSQVALACNFLNLLGYCFYWGELSK